MKQPLFAVAIVVVLGLVIGLYIARMPSGANHDVARVQGELKTAIRAEAEFRARAAAAEQALEHAHTLVVRDTVKLHPHVAAYDFGKTHLDTTSIDSLKAQLQRADTVIVGLLQVNGDQLDELARAHELLAVKDNQLQAKDWRDEKLVELNAAIAAQIPTRRQQLTHDAKVVAVVVGTIGSLALAFGR